MKTTKLIVMALLCLNFASMAQEQPTLPILKLQQKLPETIWNETIEVLGAKGNITKSTLAAYKGKLIILDFWATWCTTCIKTLPHLDSLQQQFKAKVQILLVNAKIKGDTQAKIQNRLKGHQITSIINNEALKQLFPYEFIPHYVWIDQQGRLYAITTADMVNETNINHQLNQQH